jgi:hypothetical protein
VAARDRRKRAAPSWPYTAAVERLQRVADRELPADDTLEIRERLQRLRGAIEALPRGDSVDSVRSRLARPRRRL